MTVLEDVVECAHSEGNGDLEKIFPAGGVGKGLSELVGTGRGDEITKGQIEGTVHIRENG